MKKHLSAMQICSVGLAVFSVLFGFTWIKREFCLGDSILMGLGLPAWSSGTQGTHYSAILALILLLVAFVLFTVAAKRIRSENGKTSNDK